MIDFLREYFQHPEGLPWGVAVFVCAWLALFRIFCECGKYRNRKNRTLFSKYLWYSGVIYIRNDDESESHVAKYLSYYSILVLIMSGLEYVVEGNVGLLARLEMWGVVGAFIGYKIFSVLGLIIGALYGIRIVNRNGGRSLASIMTSFSFAGMVMFGWLGSLVFMAICYVMITYWRELDIWAVAIAGIIPALIIFYELIVVVIKENDMRRFAEKTAKEYRGLNCIGVGDPARISDNPFPSVVKPIYKGESQD